MYDVPNIGSKKNGPSSQDALPEKNGCSATANISHPQTNDDMPETCIETSMFCDPVTDWLSSEPYSRLRVTILFKLIKPMTEANFLDKC